MDPLQVSNMPRPVVGRVELTTKEADIVAAVVGLEEEAWSLCSGKRRACEAGWMRVPDLRVPHGCDDIGKAEATEWAAVALLLRDAGTKILKTQCLLKTTAGKGGV